MTLSIELRQASVRFAESWVLDRISLRLTPGERYALIGANGAGKTQLLKLIAGTLWPTPTPAGRRVYRRNGVKVSDMEAKSMLAYVGAELQDKYELRGWNMSVRDLVATGVQRCEILLEPLSTVDSRRVERTLRECGLLELAGQSFFSLSYGERRLAMIARALAGNPRWLLLDEIYNGLDESVRARLSALLRKARARGQSWVIAAHRTGDVPEGTTHWLQMNAGRLRRLPVRRSKSRTAELPAAPSRATRGAPADATQGASAHATLGAPADRTPIILRVIDADLYLDDVCVLRQINWTWRHGESWAVVGNNGSGKSSFLKLLYGDLAPAFGGHVRRGGFAPGAAIEEWKNTAGFISPQLQSDYALDIPLEHLVVSGRHSSIGLNDAPSDAELQSARFWLQFFGLSELARRPANQLSYGQARLSLFARAMAAAPRLLLLDEPLTGLDDERRHFVRACLTRLIARGLNLVIVAHHTSDVPQGVNRILRLHKRTAREAF